MRVGRVFAPPPPRRPETPATSDWTFGTSHHLSCAIVLDWENRMILTENFPPPIQPTWVLLSEKIAFTGAFTPVLARHSKNFSPRDIHDR